MSGRSRAPWGAMVLVLMLASGLLACSDSSSDSDERSVPLSVPPGIQCPDPPVAAPSAPTTSLIPAGATEVRLCGSDAFFPVQEPRDSLVTDIGALTRLVNGRPEQQPDAFDDCALRIPVSYVMAFGYADGTMRTVSGLPGVSAMPAGSVMPPEPPGGWPAPGAAACDRIEVGGVLRSGPDLVLDEFTTLLERQRTDTEPNPDWSRRQGCRRGSTGASQVATIDDAVEATMCVTFSVGHPVPVSVAVPPDDLTTLLSDRSRTTSSGGCPPTAPRWNLVGTTAWGDTVSASGDCSSWLDSDDRTWVPGPEARAVLDRLVGSADPPTPQVDSRSSERDVAAAYADLLNAGDTAAAAQLWRGEPQLPRADLDDIERIEEDDGQTVQRGESTYLDVYWREVLRDGSAAAPRRHYRFEFRRDPVGYALQIVGVTDLGVV